MKSAIELKQIADRPVIEDILAAAEQEAQKRGHNLNLFKTERFYECEEYVKRFDYTEKDLDTLRGLGFTVEPFELKWSGFLWIKPTITTFHTIQW